MSAEKKQLEMGNPSLTDDQNSHVAALDMQTAGNATEIVTQENSQGKIEVTNDSEANEVDSPRNVENVGLESAEATVVENTGMVGDSDDGDKGNPEPNVPIPVVYNATDATSGQDQLEGDEKQTLDVDNTPVAEDSVMAEEVDSTEEGKTNLESDNSGTKKSTPDGENDEDEDNELENESEEESRPGLLEQPLIQEGRRQRAQTERLQLDTEVRDRPKVVIPDGKGTPLGEIEHIREQLSRLPPSSLKEVHTVLFATPGTKHTLKNDIKKFKGFVFETEVQRTKKLEYIEKKKMEVLKFMCDLFGLQRVSDKHALATIILEFLENPSNTSGRRRNVKALGTPAKKRKTPSKTPRSKAKGKEATASSTSAGNRDKLKRPRNSYLIFSADKRPEVMKETKVVSEIGSRLGEMWRNLPEAQKSKYEAQSRQEFLAYDAAVKALGEGGSESKGEKKESKSDKKEKSHPKSDKKGEKSDSAVAKKRTSVKRKTGKEADTTPHTAKTKKRVKKGPSDSEIEEVIRRVSKEVGLEVTFKHMREALMASFPTLDVEARRDELKLLAQSIVTSEQRED